MMRFDPQTTLDVVTSRHALSAAGSGSFRLSDLQCLLNKLEGKESFGPAVFFFWKYTIEQADPFLPEVWGLRG